MNLHPRTAPVPGAPGAGVPASAGYRFAVVSDETAWPGTGGPGGLLHVREEAQIDGLDRLTDGGDALVLVCGPREAEAARRASALARSRSQARIAVVPVPLGPLGQLVVTVLGRELVAGSTSRPAAELISWLPIAAGAVLDLALVSSVAKLDQPGVAVRHHLMSWVPGRRLFVVQISPATGVARVTRAGQLRPDPAPLSLPDVDDTYGAAVTVAGPRRIPEVVLHYCRTSHAPAALPTSAALSSYWRDADATEVVVAPADVLRWASDALPAVTMTPCAWCAEPLAAATARCVFCGHLTH